jgi:hypothetical protein
MLPPFVLGLDELLLLLLLAGWNELAAEEAPLARGGGW